jgi:hypothetical protein
LVKTGLLRWSICNERGEHEPDREADARGERHAVYESARQALSAAVKVDEVNDLLDRSAALVEYARRAAVTQSGIKEPGAISAI